MWVSDLKKTRKMYSERVRPPVSNCGCLSLINQIYPSPHVPFFFVEPRTSGGYRKLDIILPERLPRIIIIPTDDEGSSSGQRQHMSTTAIASSSSSEGQGGRRKRVRLFTPADRATHRVVEKQRREALNGHFIELARLLPGLASTRRLSKSIIVNESIAHQKKQRAERLACAKQLRGMMAEQEALVEEVNTLRMKLGIAERREGPGELSVEATDVLRVDEEVFGAFPAGFGDNGDTIGEEQDVDGEENAEMNAERGRRRRAPSKSNSARSNKTSTSESRSARNASGSERISSSASSSSSPARLDTWINGIEVELPAGSPLATTSSPAQTPPASSFPPSESLIIEPPPVVPHDADFMAMLSTESGPSDPSYAEFFAMGPSVGSHSNEYDVNIPIFPQPPPPPPQVQMGFFSNPTAVMEPDEMWNFMQQAPGANVLQASGAGLFSVGTYGGFPVPAPSPSIAYGAYPSMAVHLGTHGGFTLG
ncbi:hypothetical protein FB45DRAFT_919990 [Roridomyces roridus]|uniref:BHLH domain-containing protein n=1 Tax=Roridomyces roridus TaxID=1738132 RepID=A0AAD7FKC4_9AGAR|nr:hypothetical protein FB45DRAFT_919990 [Roridomyces roridus]